MDEAKEHWQTLEKASEKSLKDIENGLRISFSAMKKAVEKAKDHFSDEKTIISLDANVRRKKEKK